MNATSDEKKKVWLVTQETLEVEIKGMEMQLAMVKAELKRLTAGDRTRAFADLYGILSGQSETTEEDFEAVKYRVKQEDWVEKKSGR